MLLTAIYNLSVSKKLMLFALVPTLTIIFFAFDTISNQNTLREQHKITQDFIATALILVDVVTQLQKERSLDLAINNTRVSSSLVKSLTNQQRKTDDSITHYLDFLASLKSTPKEWLREIEFKHLQHELDMLTNIRLRDKSINGFNLYSKLINATLSILQSLQTSSDDASLASKISLYSTLLLLQEYLDQERSLINDVFLKHKVSVLRSHTINSIINKQKELLNFFNSIAPEALKNKIQQLLNSPIHNDIEQLKQTVTHRAERSDLLNRLQVFFGYGGMIHSFKNYLLRSNKRDLFAFNFAAREAKNIIHEMMQLKGISTTELNYLTTIQNIVDVYNNKMQLMQQLKKDHLTIKQIDIQVSINDYPAFIALTSLLEGRVVIDNKLWWEKTSQQLHTLKTLSNEIKGSIQQLSIHNVGHATQQFYLYLILTGVALLIIILLSSIILRRLVIDLGAISKSMSRMVA